MSIGIADETCAARVVGCITGATTITTYLTLSIGIAEKTCAARFDREFTTFIASGIETCTNPVDIRGRQVAIVTFAADAVETLLSFIRTLHTPAYIAYDTFAAVLFLYTEFFITSTFTQSIGIAFETSAAHSTYTIITVTRTFHTRVIGIAD